jgi:hypothetical protein
MLCMSFTGVCGVGDDICDPLTGGNLCNGCTPRTAVAQKSLNTKAALSFRRRAPPTPITDNMRAALTQKGTYIPVTQGNLLNTADPGLLKRVSPAAPVNVLRPEDDNGWNITAVKEADPTATETLLYRQAVAYQADKAFLGTNITFDQAKASVGYHNDSYVETQLTDSERVAFGDHPPVN